MKRFGRTMMGLAALVGGLASNALEAAPLARGNHLRLSGLLAAALPGPCPVQTTPLNSTAVDGVPGNGTPDDLVRAIVGSGVAVSNIRFRGVVHSAGSFANAGSVLGFSDGIVLSSGDISNVNGPNGLAGVSRQNGLAGDTDLDGLILGNVTQDATVLEFDFIPDKDVISFQYVFASDEYNEFANTSYNDVFGFFLNGTNVALLPSTRTSNYVVSINNVNGGNVVNNSATTTNAMNPAFYRDNEDGHICTEMDGLTVVLDVLAGVHAHAINHIKLAIADAGDDRLDSNIFIKSGSFSANHPPTAVCSPPVNTNPDGSVTPGVSVADADGDALTVVWSVNGLPAATNQVPGSVPTTSASLTLTRIFPPGTNTVSVAVSDGKAVAVCSALVVASNSIPVLGGYGMKKGVLREMTALRATVTDKHDGDELDEAIEELADSLAPKLWLDETHLRPKYGERVFHEEKESVQELLELIKDKKSRVPHAILQSYIDRMVAVDRLLAEVAIGEAVKAGRNSKKLAEARKELEKGDMELAEGEPQEAIEHYGHAWKDTLVAKIEKVIRPPNGNARLEILGFSRENYLIQSSTNLTDWVTVDVLVADQDGAADYILTLPSADPMRFYRIIAP
jgi:hypothetical protein